MSRRSTLEFLKTETGSGLLLALAALAAVILANSPWAWAYTALTKHNVLVQVGPFIQEMSVTGWVKTALMPIFFFVVGLEIKHEVLRGELSNPRRLALPVLAAAGGVVVPALIYLAINASAGRHLEGWPIPTATDIAFALAALAAAGPRMPPTLRVFLLTLAIADDIGAVGLIGILFSHDLHPRALVGAGAALLFMMGLGRWRSAPFLFYAVGFALAWAFTLKSGVSTSVAGVLAAFTVPVGPRRRGQESVLRHFMDSLHPYVAYGILPLFAFVAAGFSFNGLTGAHFTSPQTLGIVLGLFLGKQVGVFGAVFLAVTLGFGRKPTGATWLEVWGLSLLCGVGFTMSLFIGALAFPEADPQHAAQVRAGVLLGSLSSVAVGLAVLRLSAARRARDPD